MSLDLWTSSKTKVANWTAVSLTPDITFEYSGYGNHYHVTADIISLGQSGGGRPTESIPTFGNKRINTEKPQEDFEVKFDVAFTTTFWDAVMMNTVYAAGGEISNSSTKTRWRIIITWQDPEALAQTAAEKLRWVYKDCTCVSWEPEMSGDEYVKGTITFKVPAFDSSGATNLIKEYETAADFTTLASAHGGAEGSYTYTG